MKNSQTFSFVAFFQFKLFHIIFATREIIKIKIIQIFFWVVPISLCFFIIFNMNLE